MTSVTNYYIDTYDASFVDLNTIFSPYSGGTTASATGFVVKNYAGITGQTDLNQIFEPYSSGGQAPPTGYVVDNGLYPPNQDLADIFQYVYSFPFVFTPDSSSNYVVSSLSGGYNMIQFKIGTFSFQPTTSIQLYDLFLVAGGANGTKSGGKGGKVVDLSFNTNPLTVDPTYSFSLTVGAGTQDSSSNVLHNSIPYTPLTATAIGGGGANGGPAQAGNGSTGTTNIYTQLYYGGGGGGGGTVYQGGGIGGLGGGGGGGSGSDDSVITKGGDGGGISSSINGGSGGNGAVGTSSPYGGGGGGCGINSPGYNGGNGSTGGGSDGIAGINYGGGGGGGGYYGGGGGGSYSGDGNGGGGGGAGVILLIYK